MAKGLATAKTNPTRELKIVAEWIEGQPVWADVTIPHEAVAPGPRGYRVHVVDYDASTKKFNPPVMLPINTDDIGNPALHAQNVYAIVMRTLSRFELALGRNVGWSFDGGHQIHVAPHAFSGANAFYSRRDRGFSSVISKLRTDATFIPVFPRMSSRTKPAMHYSTVCARGICMRHCPIRPPFMRHSGTLSPCSRCSRCRKS